MQIYIFVSVIVFAFFRLLVEKILKRPLRLYTLKQILQVLI